MITSGDAELAERVVALAGRAAKTVAAAVVDLDHEPRTVCASIGADIDARFEIGSITKGLTGMLLAAAVDRGEVSLDTIVGLIAPETAGTALGSVTMQELATHTSGLPRLPASPAMLIRALSSALLGLDPYRGTTVAALTATAQRQRLRRRGRHHYSNLGAAVLGQALATAAGSDYSSLLRDRILLPLGMRSTSVGDARETVARGWSAGGWWAQGRHPRPRPWRMGAYAPAGGVVSNIGDMSRLAAALLDGSAPGGRALVAVEGVATDRPQRRSGMFWIIDPLPDGATMIWHNGQTGGYSAFIALFPQAARGVVVLANVANASVPQRIALELARPR